MDKATADFKQNARDAALEQRMARLEKDFKVKTNIGTALISFGFGVTAVLLINQRKLFKNQSTLAQTQVTLANTQLDLLGLVSATARNP